jgi:hypothetical protein
MFLNVMPANNSRQICKAHLEEAVIYAVKIFAPWLESSAGKAV